MKSTEGINMDLTNTKKGVSEKLILSPMEGLFKKYSQKILYLNKKYDGLYGFDFNCSYLTHYDYEDELNRILEKYENEVSKISTIKE